MKLGWERAGVVTATLKVEELAALVAGARLAAAALAAQSAERARELERVLSGFDVALSHLRAGGGQGQPSDGAVERADIVHVVEEGSREATGG